MRPGRGGVKLRGRRGAGGFKVGSDEARRSVAVGIRNLGEREVLGIAAGGKMLGRARQQCQQRAAPRLGTAGAAREAGRNRGARERLLEIRHVTTRRMQRDRDTVEGDAAVGLGKDSTRDLDALLHLTRRRNHFDRVVERPLGRGLAAEEIILKPRDRFRRGAGARRGRRCDAERRREHRERNRVALRHGREYRGRASGERGVQLALHGRADRDVEHQDRHRGVARRRIGPDDRGRQREHRRAVDQMRPVKLGLELAQHRGQRGADFVERRQLIRTDSRQTDLTQRAGERARKSGAVSHRSEIAQRALGGDLVDRARGHRFSAESGGRHQSVAEQPLGAERAEQPRRSHPIDTEQRALRA